MTNTRTGYTPGGPMVRLGLPGLNLWQFGPRQYRCAQMMPTDIDEFARTLHLTTVLDLTEDGEHNIAQEKAACDAVPVNYARVAMDPGPACPTQTQIDCALVYLGIDMQDGKPPVIDPNRSATLLHCTHGEDRSGVVCACYQLATGMPLATVLDDFRRGHRKLDGLWGEYWFVGSILEFARRLK